MNYLLFLFPIFSLAADPALFPEKKPGYSAFMRSLGAKTPYGYGWVEKPVRAGKYSERFELRMGDCSGTDHWNDCEEDRERTELKQKSPYDSTGKQYWYAWSLFVPSDYQNIFPVKVALGQFHQDGADKPPVMFQNGSGGLAVELNQMDLKPVALVPEAELKGKWIDFLVQANWSTGADGFLQIWVNGKQHFERKGANLTQKSGGIFFKYGIYRSFLSRAKGKKLPNQVVYFDEIRQGKSRAEVEIKN